MARITEVQSEATSGGATAERRITFTCCVESGPLEQGTIRLADSIRRFGGSFAQSNIIAVTPRRGPQLASATLRRFDQLDVDYVRVAPPNRYAWMSYINKYFALKQAEQRASGDLVAWLDSDVLMLAEPSDLLLYDDEDFAACPRDKNIGTSGPGDANEAYWAKVCHDVGLDLEGLPWITTEADHERIRLYWNAGIFVYRVSSGFADHWRMTIERVLDATDASTLDKVFWTDQVALSLSTVQQGLTSRHLPGSLNYGIASHFRDHLTDGGMAGAKLLHYHDSMLPDQWPFLMQQLASTQPAAHAWLAQLGPTQPSRALRPRLTRNGLRSARQVRRRLWSRAHGAGGLGR